MRWLPLIAWTAIILLSASDAMSAQSTGGWLSTLFDWLTPAQLAVVNFILRKLTHVVAYGIEGALALLATRRRWAAIAIAVAVAIADESLQSTTTLRGGNAWDVLLDSVAAAAIVVLLTRKRR